MIDEKGNDRPRYLFVTGRLAEFALAANSMTWPRAPASRAEVAVLADLGGRADDAQMGRAPSRRPRGNRPRDPARALPGRSGPDRGQSAGVPVEPGPEDLRDLPRHFGQGGRPVAGYGRYDIEILAEINHAPKLEPAALIGQAERFALEGADVIDLGCDPGNDLGAGRRRGGRAPGPRPAGLDR